MVKTKNNIEKRIDDFVESGLSKKQGYYIDFQNAISTFLDNYNDEKGLNKNSAPLIKILKGCGKDINAMKEYIYQVSNITNITFNKDFTGLKLTFQKGTAKKDSPLVLNGNYKLLKWYTIAKKESVKAVFIALTEEKFTKRIKKLIKDLQESNLAKKEAYIKQLEKIK